MGNPWQTPEYPWVTLNKKHTILDLEMLPMDKHYPWDPYLWVTLPVGAY